MPVVKAIVLSTRGKLLVQTGGGTRIRHKFIPHIKIGDSVWVFLNELGKVKKIEPHTYEHEDSPIGKEKKELIPINQTEFDSVE